MPLRTDAPLPSLDGVERWYNGPPDAEALAGRPVLVHFWSVGCEQCKRTLPDIREWRETYRDRGLRVIGIHRPRSVADLELGPIEAAIEEWGLEHPQALDPTGILAMRFENRYLPAFFVFDREGRLRHYQSGERGVRMIREALERVVGTKEEPPDGWRCRAPPVSVVGKRRGEGFVGIIVRARGVNRQFLADS